MRVLVSPDGLRWQLAWGGNLSQGKFSKVDTASKEVMPKLGGTAKLVGNSFSCIYPLQRTALRKGFVAKLPATRGSDTVEQLPISECVVRNANDCCPHFDDAELSARLPRIWADESDS